MADDVILNNVIGFDVKVWDPDVAGYMDLGYAGAGRFSSAGRHIVDRRNSGNNLIFNTYDTWSTHYETAGTSTGDTGLAGPRTELTMRAVREALTALSTTPMNCSPLRPILIHCGGFR